MKKIILSLPIGSEDIAGLLKTQTLEDSEIIINQDSIYNTYLSKLTQSLWLKNVTHNSKAEIDELIFYKSNNDTNNKHNSIEELSSSIYESSILYIIYRHHRLWNKKHEQVAIKNSLQQYLGVDIKYIEFLLNNNEIIQHAVEFVTLKMVAQKTIDIVLYRETEGQKEIWTIQRSWFPIGKALPWGFIQDEDETNSLDLPSHVYAALRIGSEKILWEKVCNYGKDIDSHQKEYYFVSNKSETKKLKLYMENTKWYAYKDYLERILVPSDPRHIVDTIWFEMEYDGEGLTDILRTPKIEIMDPDNKNWWFIFNHHREIVAHLSSRTNLEKERDFNHSQRIRSIINNPEQVYENIKIRFNQNNNSIETSMPELFPVVDTIKQSLFKEKINNLCKNNPALLAMRDNVDNSLTHVSFKNRIFCPYGSTIRAIYEGIKFYDIITRLEKRFYEYCNTDEPIQHNPKNIENALYHSYRYEYRYNILMWMIPDEIIIPTFEYLWATDIMKVRWVPLRFIWLSQEFIYVDEFLQSPKEFFMHDINHSYRMAMEDLSFCRKLGITREELYRKSNEFLNTYIPSIKVKKTDSKEEKEIKKIKKIILFEIIHEDARPCLPEVVWEYIQQMEWNSVPFEVPTIKDDWYREITDLMDTGISTLSYVRNKLQHGFYDEVDSQIPQIVDPEYRYAKRIAKAAYEMLVELKSKPAKEASLNQDGNVSREWLMYRVCAVWPDNNHNAKYEDPDMKIFWDWAKLLNPKRYQVE